MTRSLIDLHTHSTASDGSRAPAAIVDAAESCSLAALALTDHDTTAGLAEAAARAELYPQLHFIPGIELSAIFQAGTLHILGLGIDPHAKALVKLTAQLRQAREERNPKIIAKLQALGLAIDMEDVLARLVGPRQAKGRIVSRVHIAEALRRKGLVRSTNEAFEKYLAKDAEAFVDKERLAPADAFDAIRAAGGAAVLAHPTQLQTQNSAQLERIVRQFQACGLDGIECYHSDHTPQFSRDCLDLARKLNLLITGGSDYHGRGKPTVSLGWPRTPLSIIRKDYAKKWGIGK